MQKKKPINKRYKAQRLQAFPLFMKRTYNAVEKSAQASGMQGYLFEGADGSQVVLWECKKGGKSKRHKHDFDEYAVVLQGTFAGLVGRRKIVMKRGDECYIPAGMFHEGMYSANYRAIDAFGGQRLKMCVKKL